MAHYVIGMRGNINGSGVFNARYWNISSDTVRRSGTRYIVTSPKNEVPTYSLSWTP